MESTQAPKTTGQAQTMTPAINLSGIHPVDFVVLVWLDPVKTVTEGGIIIPDTSLERTQLAQNLATLVESGGRAFSDWKGRIPQPGDRILVNKYAGMAPGGEADEDLHRLCMDKDITAVLDPHYGRKEKVLGVTLLGVA